MVARRDLLLRAAKTQETGDKQPERPPERRLSTQVVKFDEGHATVSTGCSNVQQLNPIEVGSNLLPWVKLYCLMITEAKNHVKNYIHTFGSSVWV